VEHDVADWRCRKEQDVSYPSYWKLVRQTHEGIWTIRSDALDALVAENQRLREALGEAADTLRTGGPTKIGAPLARILAGREIIRKALERNET
jgi:hypothetical protein